jgi:hypothetical protein
MDNGRQGNLGICGIHGVDFTTFDIPVRAFSLKSSLLLDRASGRMVILLS